MRMRTVYPNTQGHTRTMLRRKDYHLILYKWTSSSRLFVIPDTDLRCASERKHVCELHRVASQVVQEYCDGSMTHILTSGRFNPGSNYGLNPFLFEHRPLMQGDAPRSTPAPTLANAMTIDEAAFYTLLHNRPGSLNSTTGVAIDYALRVGRRSMFGYSLSRLIAPTGVAAANFRRQFAFLVCLPRRYQEAIVEYDRLNPQSPFVPQMGPIFALRRARISATSASNISQQDVINVLLDNRIPPEWIAHAYPYGFIFLNSHYAGSSIHQGLLDAIDHERLARLHMFGTPNPIPSWDGWRHPSDIEISHSHYFRASEDDTRRRKRQSGSGAPSTQRAVTSSSRWLTVGTSGVSEYLAQRPRQVAEDYAASHPLVLMAPPQTSAPSGEPAILGEGAPTNVVAPSSSQFRAEAGPTNVVPPPPSSSLVMTPLVDMTASPLSAVTGSSEDNGVDPMAVPAPP